MKNILSSLFFVLFLIPSISIADQAQFPTMPNEKVTPGAVCEHPDSYRYPEHIAYCNRNVTTQQKDAVIREYDQMFGYSIESMDRMEFKIDHYIPLCMGGANDETNLWPQHKSVYVITDPLELLLCQKMEAGRLHQADAIALMKKAKNNLDQTPSIIKSVEGL